jgi:multicomponent K+:H+ antiporter subunit A
MGEIAVLSMAGIIVYVLLSGFVTRTAPAAPASENTTHPLLLQVVATLLMPLAAMVSIYFFLRGHNQPGGGFIAGLVFAIAIILQYVALGEARFEARMRLQYNKWIGAGLLSAGLTGTGSFFVAHPFLTSAFKYFALPVVGDVPIASAMFFDLGVYLAVIGATMLALSVLGGLRGRGAAS